MSRRQAILNPKGTTCSAKRFVGRKHDEVTSELKAVFLDVVPGPKVRCAFDVAANVTALKESRPRCWASWSTTRPSSFDRWLIRGDPATAGLISDQAAERS